MDANRWTRINEVFFAALERDGGQRMAFLDQACGDDSDLRSHVDALLAADSDPGVSRFLEPSLGRAASKHQVAQPWIGAQLGDYRIERLLGKGGMGNVYLAARVTDFEQRVAIKVLKRGLDTDEILNRFRDEIQFLAALGRHPNIAGLRDAGTTDDGLPYFVMDYVDGMRIDAYCDQENLDTRQRLQMFQTVCQSVQFAHQHAVIHRDLKPSNILVTSDGVPQLIDFGIAKLIDSHGQSEPTHTQARMLTPEYASPEQIRGEVLSTTSDVYSLGVVLYELLTGRSPYPQRDRLRDGVPSAIGEADPEKPSTAVGAADTQASGQDGNATRPQRGDSRRSQTKQLRRLLAGDIDNMVLMALRKEPSRRYASAEQFSTDIQRHLDGRPVIACRDTWRYRWGKFVRRNRFVVAAGLLIGLSLLAGILGTSTQWLRAELHAQRAQRARQDAEENFQTALDAVDRMLNRVGEFNGPGMGAIRRELLYDALEFYQAFLQKNQDNEHLQHETGRAYSRIGFVNRLLGNHDESETALRNSIRILELLETTDARLSSEVQRDAAKAHYHLGVLLALIDRNEEAERAYLRSIELVQELAGEDGAIATDNSLLASAYNDLGNLLWAQGSLEPAEAALRKALAIRQGIKEIQEPGQLEGLANSLVNLANLLLDRNEFAEAEQFCRDALALHAESQDKVERTASIARIVSGAHFNLGSVLLDTNRLEQAEVSYRSAIHIQTHLVRDYPSLPEYKFLLAASQHGLGRSLLPRLQDARAATAFRAAIGLLEPLSLESPEVSKYRDVLASSLSSLSEAIKRTDRTQSAELEQQAHQLRLQLVADFPDDRRFQKRLAASHLQRGMSHRRRKEFDQAAREYRDAIQVYRQGISRRPDASSMSLAWTYFHLGVVQTDAKKLAEAESAFQQAISSQQAVVSKTPGDRHLAGLIHYALANLVRVDPNRWDEAEANYRAALEDYAQLTSDFPKIPIYRHIRAQVHNNLGSLLSDRKRYGESEEKYLQAANLFRALVDEHPQSADYRFDLGGAYINLGIACQMRTATDQAESWYLKAREQFQLLCDTHSGVAIYQDRLDTTLQKLQELQAAVDSGGNDP